MDTTFGAKPAQDPDCFECKYKVEISEHASHDIILANYTFQGNIMVPGISLSLVASIYQINR